MKRLGLLVIGDEILAGHVQETNGHWLAKRCKEMGIELARVEVCTDELDDIEASTRRFLNDLGLDYAITSGGLGPTPDDRTMEGIGRSIGKPLVMTPEWETWMRERVAFGHKLGYFQQSEPNPGMWKMAHLPEGAEAMPNNRGTALGAIIANGKTTLFTLPGVPAEFERMFDESIAPRLSGTTPPHVAELKLYTEESRFYETLARLEKSHPSVTLGSYPQRGHIMIRATGPAQEAEAVIKEMRTAGAAYLKPRQK